jgi:hypothetical protein
MKIKSRISLVLAVPMLFLFCGCQNLNPKEARLNRMCNCMENNKEDLNNRAAKQLLGNAFMTNVARETALDCAQKIAEKDNLNYTEMWQLFIDFSNSDCGKNYKIDQASVDKSVKEATEDANRIIRENSNKLEWSAEDANVEVAPSQSNIESDKEVWGTINKEVNPTLDQLHETPIYETITSQYPARPALKQIQFNDNDSSTTTAVPVNKSEAKGGYTLEEIDSLIKAKSSKNYREDSILSHKSSLGSKQKYP